MPQVAQPKSRWPKVTVVVLVVLAVLGLASGYLFWRLVPSTATSIAKARSLSAKQEYTSAYSVLKDANRRAIFVGDKDKLLNELAIASYNARDYQASYSYESKINAKHPNDYQTLTSLAGVAELAGRKADAITDYKLALKFMPSQDKQRETGPSAEFIQQNINRLEASQ